MPHAAFNVVEFFQTKQADPESHEIFVLIALQRYASSGL
jgi:hypothetical protein